MNLYFLGCMPQHEFKDLIKTCSYELLTMIRKDVTHFYHRLMVFRSLYPNAPMHYYDQDAITEAIEIVDKEIMDRLFDWTFTDGIHRAGTGVGQKVL